MKIKPSSYIRNDYAELSSYCRETGEPVYLTKNGEGDIVVLSIDAYERLTERLKRLEAKYYLLQKFGEADEYNKNHPETYTIDQAEEILEALLREKEAGE